MAEQAGPGLKTRRDCTLLGAKVFASGMAAALLLAAVVHAFYWHSRGGAGRFWNLSEIGTDLWYGLIIGVPPAVLVGAVAGFELYRVAVGSREWRPVGCLVWVLLVVPLGYMAPLLYLQYRRREKLILERAPIRWWLPAVYGVILLLIDLTACEFSMRDERRILLICGGGFLSLFLSDSVLVNVIARWRNEGRLAPPVSHTFQYSLGTLLIFVLGMGAWMTALAKLFK
ncbi:MAG: hypothetical protein NTW87_13060 [Planctomycetota bacterium]|nr:hypothetical protein [Planctomycetota bacterium]